MCCELFHWHYNFLCFQKAIDIVGFSKEEVIAIYQLLSAILNLGNAEVTEVTTSDGTEAAAFTNDHGKPVVCISIPPSPSQRNTICFNTLYNLYQNDHQHVIKQPVLKPITWKISVYILEINQCFWRISCEMILKQLFTSGSDLQWMFISNTSR